MTDKVTLKLIHDANLLTNSMKGFKIYFALCKFTRDTVILYNTHGQPAIKLVQVYRCTGVQVCTVILYNTHGQPAIKLEPRIEWMTPPATHTRTCPFIRFCVAKNITQSAITDILLLKHYLRSVLGFIPLAPKNGSVSCCNLQKCDSNFCSWSRNKEWKIAL